MDLMKYAKPLALATSMALLAGCGSSGGTQDQASEPMQQEEVAPVQTSDEGAQASAVDQDSNASADDMTGEKQTPNVMMPDENRIYFDFDKSTIRQDAYQTLNAHARYLLANKDANVVLEGHTDERGSREYNMALGERRADAVKRYLTLQGVETSQMEVVSYGEERPAVMGHSLDAYAKNRRVVIRY